MASSTAKTVERGLVGALIGVIDAIMVVPVTISFAAIIFRHDVFAAYLPSLIKLTLFSSAIHQLAFTWNSGLNFAVGQVQDAGLIFLSSMAGDIADTLLDRHQDAAIVPTALFVLPIYTALMGLVLVLIGRLHLASVIQYLPMPVVGGYLAFIGFYCGQAGLSMMSGEDLQTIRDWPLLLHPHALLLLAPGLCYGVLMYVLLRNVRSPFTLPACMIAMLGTFYALLWLTDTTLQAARNDGWVYHLTPQVLTNTLPAHSNNVDPAKKVDFSPSFDYLMVTHDCDGSTLLCHLTPRRCLSTTPGPCTACATSSGTCCCPSSLGS